MSLPRYPKYKDSGSEWLGVVPVHWEVWKLAHAFEIIGSGTTPKTDKREYYDEGDIPWINTGDLDDGDLENCDKRITTIALADHSSLRLYPAGSVLIAMYGATIGKLAMLRFPATVNQACCVFAGTSPIVAKFMFFWFLGLRQQILSLATGGGQPNVSQDILRTLRVGCPNQAEQTLIATFLDRETAKIDGLVAEQQRLIELLKEKRQAVISHAVTRGRNPNAPMKPSGIEWPTHVPADWTVKRIKHLVADSGGIQMGPFGGMLLDLDSEETGFKVFGQENTISGNFCLGSRWISKGRFESLANYHIANGDLLLTRKGSLGNARLVQNLRQPGIVDSDTIRIRVNGLLIMQTFLALLLHEARYVSEQITLSKRGAILPGLNSDTVANIAIILPPLDQQREVMGVLTKVTSEIDDSIGACENATNLLQERRTALISAAVTGKIDVRGLVETEAA